jgi:hypothetical protein
MLWLDGLNRRSFSVGRPNGRNVSVGLLRPVARVLFDSKGKLQDGLHRKMLDLLWKPWLSITKH